MSDVQTLFPRSPSWSMIPVHMHGAMERYIQNGILPGSFLEAVLSNNLRDAVARADDINRDALPDYVRFLYNHAPSFCWGSPEAVEEWCKAGGLAGLLSEKDGA